MLEMSPKGDTRSVSSEGEEHDTRAAALAHSSIQPKGTEVPVPSPSRKAGSKAEGKPVDEEKPTWQEVLRTTAEESLTVGKSNQTKLPKSNVAEDDLMTPLHKHSDDDDATIALTSPGNGCASSAVKDSQQRYMDETLGSDTAAAVLHARLDSFEASVEGKLDSVAAKIAEQGRIMDGRLGKLEKVMQRLETMMQRAEVFELTEARSDANAQQR